MFDKVFLWIGSHARGLVLFLAVIVGANVLFQAYTHKTTPLLAWKGGGFGMYTEPHVEDRSVWLTFNSETGSASVRLFPETPEFADWRAAAGLRGTSFLNTMQSTAERLLYFPRSKSAEDLVGYASRVRWPENLVGIVKPTEGKVFKRSDITLTVFENRYDVSAQTVTRSVVFKHSSKGDL